MAKGHIREAASLLKKIDAHYAGLAAPESVELARQIAASLH
jgi:hypothetical protein